MRQNSILEQYNWLRGQAASLLPPDHPLYKQTTADSRTSKPDAITLADAELYLVAAQRAIRYKQYEIAIIHLKRGRKTLGSGAWEHSYDLVVEICIELGKAENLNTNFNESLEIAEVIIGNAKSNPELIKGYELKILTLGILSEKENAIKAIFELFEIIGFKLEDKCPNITDISQFHNLPEIQEDWKISLLRIIKILGELAYTINPKLCPLVGFTEIKFCIEHGKCPLYLQCFADYALLLVCFLDNVELGYSLGKLAANDLTEETLLSKPAVLEIFNGHIRFWKEPIYKSIQQLEDAFRFGLEIRDFMMASISAILRCDQLRVAGERLQLIYQTYLRYLEIFSKMNLEYPKPYAKVGIQLICNLIGTAKDPSTLKGEFFDEEKDLPNLVQCRDHSPIFLFYLAKTQLNYFLGSYQVAIKSANTAKEYSGAASGLVTNVEHNFYESLSLLAYYPNTGPAEQAGIRRKIESHQQQMKIWADNAPMNFRQKFLLVEAERHRYGLGDSPQHRQDDEAIVNYQQAIAFAQEQGFIQDVALASELAGEFFHKRGQLDAAERYLRDARSQYKTWGATTKVEQLEFKYPWLGSDSGLQVTASGSVQSSKDLSSPKNRTLIQFVDVARRLQTDLCGCELNFIETQKALTIGYPDLDNLSRASRNDRGRIARGIQDLNVSIDRIRLYSGRLVHREFWVTDYA